MCLPRVYVGIKWRLVVADVETRLALSAQSYRQDAHTSMAKQHDRTGRYDDCVKALCSTVPRIALCTLQQACRCLCLMRPAWCVLAGRPQRRWDTPLQAAAGRCPACGSCVPSAHGGSGAGCGWWWSRREFAIARHALLPVDGVLACAQALGRPARATALIHPGFLRLRV